MCWLYALSFFSFLACANYIHFLLYIYTSIVFFVIYYVTFFHKTKHVFSIQTTVLTCRRTFSLHQSICKTEVSRVKVNSTNNWNSRWKNSIQHDNLWLTAWVTTGVKQNQNWRWWTCAFVLNVICGKKICSANPFLRLRERYNILQLPVLFFSFFSFFCQHYLEYLGIQRKKTFYRSSKS